MEEPLTYPRRQLQKEFLNVFNVIVQVMKKKDSKRTLVVIPQTCLRTALCITVTAVCVRAVEVQTFINNYLQCSVSCHHFCPRYTPRGSLMEAQRECFRSDPSLDPVLFLSTVQYFYIHPHSVTWVMLPKKEDQKIKIKSFVYDIITMSVGRSTCRLCVYILSELNI